MIVLNIFIPFITQFYFVQFDRKKGISNSGGFTGHEYKYVMHENRGMNPVTVVGHFHRGD